LPVPNDGFCRPVGHRAGIGEGDDHHHLPLRGDRAKRLSQSGEDRFIIAADDGAHSAWFDLKTMLPEDANHLLNRRR
jgi:hypothetical protein